MTKNVNLAEILNEFQKNYDSRTHMERDEKFLLNPDSVFPKQERSDLPSFTELYREAELKELDMAHPKGSVALNGISAKDGLAVVEDLKGQHKRMLEVVQKEVKLAEVSKRLAVLANKLDSVNLKHYADEVDQISAFIVNAEDSQQHLTNIEKALDNLQALLHMAKGPGKADGQKALDEALVEFNKIYEALSNKQSPDLTAFKNALTVAAKALKIPAAWQAFELASESLGQLEESFNLGESNLPQTQTQTQTQAPDAKVKSTAPHSGMLAVQKKINEVANALEKLNPGTKLSRVPENGNQADEATWAVVKNEPFNFVAGKDFKNYKELFSLIESVFTSYDVGLEASPGSAADWHMEAGVDRKPEW